MYICHLCTIYISRAPIDDRNRIHKPGICIYKYLCTHVNMSTTSIHSVPGWLGLCAICCARFYEALWHTAHVPVAYACLRIMSMCRMKKKRKITLRLWVNILIIIKTYMQSRLFGARLLRARACSIIIKNVLQSWEVIRAVTFALTLHYICSLYINYASGQPTTTWKELCTGTATIHI